MSVHTREEILDLLHTAGGKTVFYQRLFYTERLSDEFERLAHQILGTRLWNFIAQHCGECPESVPVKDIQTQCCNTEAANTTPPLKWSDPPTPQSLWCEFVLDSVAYETAVARLDLLIQEILLREVDRGI